MPVTVVVSSRWVSSTLCFILRLTLTTCWSFGDSESKTWASSSESILYLDSSILQSPTCGTFPLALSHGLDFGLFDCPFSISTLPLGQRDRYCCRDFGSIAPGQIPRRTVTLMVPRPVLTLIGQHQITWRRCPTALQLRILPSVISPFFFLCFSMPGWEV